eukprot:3562357-Rhodomonas_salina.3
MLVRDPVLRRRDAHWADHRVCDGRRSRPLLPDHRQRRCSGAFAREEPHGAALRRRVSVLPTV